MNGREMYRQTVDKRQTTQTPKRKTEQADGQECKQTVAAQVEKAV